MKIDLLQGANTLLVNLDAERATIKAMTGTDAGRGIDELARRGFISGQEAKLLKQEAQQLFPTG